MRIQTEQPVKEKTPGRELLGWSSPGPDRAPKENEAGWANLPASVDAQPERRPLPLEVIQPTSGHARRIGHEKGREVVHLRHRGQPVVGEPRPVHLEDVKVGQRCEMCHPGVAPRLAAERQLSEPRQARELGEGRVGHLRHVDEERPQPGEPREARQAGIGLDVDEQESESIEAGQMSQAGAFDVRRALDPECLELPQAGQVSQACVCQPRGPGARQRAQLRQPSEVC